MTYRNMKPVLSEPEEKTWWESMFEEIMRGASKPEPVRPVKPAVEWPLTYKSVGQCLHCNRAVERVTLDRRYMATDFGIKLYVSAFCHGDVERREGQTDDGELPHFEKSFQKLLVPFFSPGNRK